MWDERKKERERGRERERERENVNERDRKKENEREISKTFLFTVIDANVWFNIFAGSLLERLQIFK